MFAKKITESMKYAIELTSKGRKAQEEFNKKSYLFVKAL